MSTLSSRLEAIVDTLPLRPGMRALETCGDPGAAARAIAACIGDGHILTIDRSAKSVGLAEKNAAAKIDLQRISDALTPSGQFIDGGNPIRDFNSDPAAVEDPS